VESLVALLAATGHRLALLPTAARPAAEAAQAIAGHLRVLDEDRAFREVIQLSDDLGAAPADVRVALVVTPPPPTGDPRYDALLAGVVEEHLLRSRLPVPEWVRHPSRRLSQRWYVDDNPYTRALSDATALAGPLRHNVVLAASELASV